MSTLGYFDRFGGRYVAEILQQPLVELEQAFTEALADPAFLAELEEQQRNFVGRPTPLLYAGNASRELGGPPIYIKLEGLAHTGAHKINNAIGQAMLAKRMGKARIIAETGAGQHGIATAAACARLGLECVVYMGDTDVRRQQPNVAGMELYGATVVPVHSGAKTLKDAINEAMRDWATHFETTHYLIGSALGPSPFPDIVRTFQSVIGDETKRQMADRGIGGGTLVACVGGGSNAMGFFSAFLDDPSVRLIGVEAGGRGPAIGDHAVRMSGSGAEDGIIHGYKSRFLVDADGQVAPTHSVSAGLDYPGIGPQLAALGERGRVSFTSATDAEALEAVNFFARTEGVMFALESAHAGAAAIRLARQQESDEPIVINMSGRGEKDLFITSPLLRLEEWKEFLVSELARIGGTE
ncbi:MAG: tryptophan synthase subunit beta [Sphaerochaetaceae bacterium]